MKLYRVKSEAPALQLPSGNSNSTLFSVSNNHQNELHKHFFHTTDKPNSVIGVQVVSSLVQRGVPQSSSKAFSKDLPVSYGKREKIQIKQESISDGEPWDFVIMNTEKLTGISSKSLDISLHSNQHQIDFTTWGFSLVNLSKITSEMYNNSSNHATSLLTLLSFSTSREPLNLFSSNRTYQQMHKRC